MDLPTSPNGYRYGLKPSARKPEDYLFQDHVKIMKAAALPVQHDDLFKYLPPVCNQGPIGMCHDDQTEVLTDLGFKLFSEVKSEDLLATVNTENSELTYESPTRLVRFHYVGPMYYADGNRNLDFMLTPDHNMLVREWNQSKKSLDDKYTLRPIKDIGWYAGLMNRVVWNGTNSASNTFVLKGVPSAKKDNREDKQIPMNIWLKFLGLYLAEGTLLKRFARKDRKYPSFRIQIAAGAQRKKDCFKEICQAMGWRATEFEDRFVLENKQVYENMAMMGLEGKKSGDKFVPQFVFEQSAGMIKEFLAGHFAGDGCITKEGHRSHYTGSPQLAKDLQTLVFLSGMESFISIREPRQSILANGYVVQGTLKEHRVSVCRKKNLSMERKSTIKTKQYSGEVFCAEVPTHHTLVTRRNNRILISGNCVGASTSRALKTRMAFVNYKWPFMPSALDIYAKARIQGGGSVEEDTGAYIPDAFDALNKIGVCPEDSNVKWSWPFKLDNWNKMPPEECLKAALKHKVVKYMRIENDANAIKTALYNNMPVVLGIPVYKSFEDKKVRETGVIPMPGWFDNLLGWHAVFLHGYGMYKSDYCEGRNSWGGPDKDGKGGWGDKGNFHIPFKYLTSLASDLFAIDTIL